MMDKNMMDKFGTTYIAEMEYDNSGDTRILAKGVYKGLQYIVLNIRGTHPCGYVNVANTKFDKLDYLDLDCINCHGGLTYSSEYAPFKGEEDGWWLGWDYAHLGDYNVLSVRSEKKDFSKKYTTDDVVYECIHVINQIVG